MLLAFDLLDRQIVVRDGEPVDNVNLERCGPRTVTSSSGTTGERICVRFRVTFRAPTRFTDAATVGLDG
jgi:hypothetical protein